MDTSGYSSPDVHRRFASPWHLPQCDISTEFGVTSGWRPFDKAPHEHDVRTACKSGRLGNTNDVRRRRMKIRSFPYEMLTSHPRHGTTSSLTTNDSVSRATGLEHLTLPSLPARARFSPRGKRPRTLQLNYCVKMSRPLGRKPATD